LAGFVKAKNNLAPDAKALAYSIGASDVGKDEKLGTTIRAPYIAWEEQHDVTANEAMQAEASRASSRDIAKKWLSEFLPGGAVLTDEIKAAANAYGIAERTLIRAKDDLGIIAGKATSRTEGGRGICHQV
jgi:hypothetical protein